MLQSWQTRSLFLACILSAPLLAGAEGGCGNDRLPIGGDDADAGPGAKGGSSGAGATSGTGGASGRAGAAGSSTVGAGGSGAGGSGICSLPAVVGPCNAAFQRWAFNPQSSSCERFIYGGCEGNANNFETLEACVASCDPGGGSDICLLPAGVSGPCDAAFQRWTYNRQSGSCERFIYGGCEGNANNFETLEACVGTCVPGPGEPCGPARCGAGQTCCNPSCGICTPPGGACITMECPDGCAPQDARGEGACRQLLGYKWDGFACVAISGCDCVGLDCSRLALTAEQCTNAHAGCDDHGCATERRALTDFILGNKSCASDADCQALNVGCDITEDDCTGAVYVSARTDLAAFEALRSDYFACTGGCVSCFRSNTPPVCLGGVCQRFKALP